MEYDMTDGWAFNLRPFAESERSQWEPCLAKFGVDWVGTQWMRGSTNTSPPDSFDEEVKYRPIYIKGSATAMAD